MSRTLPCLVAALLSTSIASVSLAQSSEPASDNRASMRDKLIFKGLLGLGGTARIRSTTADLDPSFGGALHYEHPVHPLLVLGGYGAVQSWTTTPGHDIGLDRSTLFDLSALVKLRFALNESLELYVAPILGVTFDSGADNVFGGKTKLGVGWNFSALVGGQFAFTTNVGLMGEMGYGMHGFAHDVTPAIGGPTKNASVTMQQFNVTAGLYVKL